VVLECGSETLTQSSSSKKDLEGRGCKKGFSAEGDVFVVDQVLKLDI
jgi:hypothetical protein